MRHWAVGVIVLGEVLMRPAAYERRGERTSARNHDRLGATEVAGEGWIVPPHTRHSAAHEPARVGAAAAKVDLVVVAARSNSRGCRGARGRRRVDASSMSPRLAHCWCELFSLQRYKSDQDRSTGKC